MDEEKSIFWNRRRQTACSIWAAVAYLAIGLLAGLLISPQWYQVDYHMVFAPPSFIHPFGTDYMGRDMFFRSLKGLSNSIMVGLASTAVSSVIALALGVAAAVKGSVLARSVHVCGFVQGHPPVDFIALNFLYDGKGCKRSAGCGGTDPLAGIDQAGAGGGAANLFRPVCAGVLPDGQVLAPGCMEPYGAAGASSIFDRRGAAVPPCHYA